MGWVKTEKTNKLSKLGDIDFTTTAPVDGNALVYDETNDVWVPGAGGSGGWRRCRQLLAQVCQVVGAGVEIVV